uniref:IQ motif and ubiquitin-like domain-containing protein n=1 Tax=Lotharella globosa TaxID=91324 RepID=A0A7S3YKJ3_9EUKA
MPKAEGDEVKAKAEAAKAEEKKKVEGSQAKGESPAAAVVEKSGVEGAGSPEEASKAKEAKADASTDTKNDAEGELKAKEASTPQAAASPEAKVASPQADAAATLAAAEAGAAAAAAAAAGRGMAASATSGSVTVEVLVMPERFRVIQEFDRLLTIKHVKVLLCKRLSLPLRRFVLHMKDGVEMNECAFLTEFCADAKSIQLVGTVSLPNEKDNDYKMPNQIEVMIDTDINGHPVIVKVDIERKQDSKKPYFGGYRDKRNGKAYHHATSQTPQIAKEAKTKKFHRETQTTDVSSKSVQSKREQGTQMARKDLYIDNHDDKIITSQAYFTTEELLELKRQKALAIQCFIRQCFAWRKVAAYYHAKRTKARRDAAAKALAEKKLKEEEEDRIRRRLNPRTKSDFTALYSELREWRHNQEKAIRGLNASEEEQSQLMKELLAKEVKLMQTIDKLRQRANSANKQEAIKARLELMASPKEWLTDQGDYIEVVTPYTTRASELVQLYNGLRLRKIPVEQRIDVLLNVKFTVKEFDCLLTREIITLCNRENDMINRGRSTTSLNGLRRRLENLFLQFIETPEFNPGAKNFQRAPAATTKLTKIFPKVQTELWTRKNP